MDKWTQYAKAIYKVENQYTPQFERVILDYRKAVIQSIKDSSPQEARALVSSQLVDVPIAPLLQKVYKKAGLVGAQMTYREIRESVKEGKKSHYIDMQVKAGFGLNEGWIAAVLDYLKLNLLNLASAISETMRKDVLNIISEGIENGWSIDKMVEGLRATGLVKTRARVIARTETVRAANVGHTIGAQSLPYEVNKIWIAAKDHRTRHSHRLVNNQSVDELETFNVPIYRNGKPTGAVDKMQAPGDSSASAGNTINCRCRVIFEAKKDAQGNFILRQNTTPARVIPMQQVPNVDLGQIAAALRKAIRVHVD